MPNRRLINAGIAFVDRISRIGGIDIVAGIAGIGSAVVVFNSDRSNNFFALSVVCAFIGGGGGVGVSVIIIDNVVYNVFRRNNIANPPVPDFVGRPVNVADLHFDQRPVQPTSVDDLGRISQLCLQLEEFARESKSDKIKNLIKNNYHNARNSFLITLATPGIKPEDCLLKISDIKLFTEENIQEILIEKLSNIQPVTRCFLGDGLEQCIDLVFDGIKEDDQKKLQKP